MKSIIEHKELIRDGCQIHYFVTGKPGNALVLFLHPAFGDHRCFDHQVNTFAEDYRVITIDLIGHGMSQPFGSKELINSSAEHLLAIIQTEGYESCHVIGVSMGSLIAQYFAYRYPDHVKSITSVGAYSIHELNKKITKAQRSEMIKWLFWAAISMKRFRKYLASVTVIHPVEQEKFYIMACSFTRKSFQVMSGLQHIVKERKEVQSTTPILLVCGDQDQEIIRESTIIWNDKDPQSKFILIKNAGHCANMDNPDRFNSTVKSFLQSQK
ncbi:alpha/beta fold hydrolase [Metabacillus herbersteinensis]|uniref:Alpha/beta fold hydrolase n=1 Tax=Metabacillus herbersteinensis TaxID=283816 RepID=A0ABV6GM57_9BACI